MLGLDYHVDNIFIREALSQRNFFGWVTDRAPAVCQRIATDIVIRAAAQWSSPKFLSFAVLNSIV